MLMAFRVCAACLLGVLLLWTLCSGIFNAGMVLVLLYVGVGLFLLFCPETLLHTPLLHRLVQAGRWLYLLFTCGALALLVWLLSAPVHQPDGQPRTLIVLGCQVKGDQPSKMLARRLDTALAYLEENPDSVCILSGGQGSNEDLPEAEVMTRYLTQRGIDPQRLYAEPNSHSTAENLAFSAAIIRAEDLPQQVVVVTDGFHQRRGQWFAEQNGLSASGLSSGTVWNMLACYYAREVLAVAKMLLLGH